MWLAARLNPALSVARRVPEGESAFFNGFSACRVPRPASCRLPGFAGKNLPLCRTLLQSVVNRTVAIVRPRFAAVLTPLFPSVTQWRPLPRRRNRSRTRRRRRLEAKGERQEEADHDRGRRGRPAAGGRRRISISPACSTASRARSTRRPAEAPPPKPLVFFDLPDFLVNLNSGGAKKASFLKLSVSLELEKQEDTARLQAVMPRIVDNFQIYLRELRIEDLRGSGGIYRLREELLARVNAAVAPVKVERRAVQGNAGPVGTIMADEPQKTDEELAAEWAAATEGGGDQAAAADGAPAGDRARAAATPRSARRASSIRTRSTACSASATAAMPRPTIPAFARSSTSALVSYERLPMLEVVFDRLVRMMSTSCAISPRTTSKSRSTTSPRSASAIISIRFRCRRCSPSSRPSNGTITAC